MVLQQDNGAGPPQFDTGLPRGQSSEDVPRWLLVFGIAAACVLLVALLRYAIDLLGVVFLIVLVGFSIRAVSDWLTEGESVSGWALAAVFAGLFGTVLVGLWLFGSRDMTSDTIEMPSPVVRATDWLEAHGWGQRVLLSGSSSGIAPPPSGPGAAASASGGGSPNGPPPAAASTSAPRESPGRSEPERRAESRSGGASEAEASPAHGTTPFAPAPGAGGEPPAPSSEGTPGGAPAQGAEPQAEPASVGTSVSLSSSHATAVVGTSVRFTATVTADGGGTPSGAVVFYDGDRPFGLATARGTGASATATYSTLSLAIGDHQISAEFHSTHGFLSSRSEPIAQTVTRR